VKPPSYAAGSEVDHFARFCADQLVQSVDRWSGHPLELYPAQLEFFNEALSYDEHGLPIWQSVVQVVGRKKGKTHALAAYALYRLVTDDGSPEILLCAASDRQAGRLFDACAAFVRRSVRLSRLLRVLDYVGEIVREDGRGRVLRMSSDPARLYGFSPSLVVCDEVAQWTTPTLERAYAALTSGAGARSAPQTFTISTAGTGATATRRSWGGWWTRPRRRRTPTASRGCSWPGCPTRGRWRGCTRRRPPIRATPRR
jgi:phage terminase large subunit-like protein